MLTGFDLHSEVLKESATITVRRGVRKSDALPVVIKALHADNLSYQDKARLRYEYRMLEALSAAGVVNVSQPVTLLDHGNALAIVMADIGGKSLALHHAETPLTLREILHVAKQTALALQGVHAARIIHKDINPTNIVYNRGTGAVQVIDFGLATQLPLELQTVENLRTMEGTWNFVAPEQTGRMNRVLDYRADFYSLGATLYTLITNRVPFPIHDLSKLVHAILALQPDSIAHLQPDIPSTVAALVERLLAKMPEDRYQSAFGLHYDLLRCLEGLTAENTLQPFALGSRDRSENFNIPQKLYGREVNIEQLMAVYKTVVNGRHEALLVHGPSGIGKSAIVNQLQGSMMEHDALFASGKYEQLRRHIPFNALSQALAQVVRRVLMEPDEHLATWRRRVSAALGNIGQAVVELVPSLELLLGKQKPLPELGPQANENRLLMAFQRLFLTLCKTQPLVLFLDDLQWADSGSLKLLRMLAVPDPETAGLLLLGAYRDNEVDKGHPLTAALDDMRTAGMVVNDVLVEHMSLASISAMVCDTTRARLDGVTPLAQLILTKTGGNPFFVREFLKHLWRKELLHFEPSLGRWTWDLPAIEAAGVTDNVGELMTDKLRELTDKEQHALSLAACLGSEFKLNTLSVVNASSRQDTLAYLAVSSQNGLLVPLAHTHRFASDTTEDVMYKFAHDRIQQAAYEMLDAKERIAVHQRIGERLLAMYEGQPAETWASATVEHLNKGAELITEPARRAQLAELNLIAAKEAKRAAAYAPALDYLGHAERVLGENGWQERYDLKWQMTLELVDNEFLLGHGARADQHIDDALAHANSNFDKAEVQKRRVLCMAALTQYPQALKAGIEGLRLLNFHLPSTPSKRHVQMALLQVELARHGRDLHKLAAAPQARDPRIIAIMTILRTMFVPAFFANTQLVALVVLSDLRLMLQHGNSPNGASTFATAAVVYAHLGKVAMARRYAQGTHAAIEAMPNVNVGSSLYSINTFVEFAWMHPGEHAAYFDKAFAYLLEEGDLLFAGLLVNSDLRTVALMSTDECLVRVEKYRSFVQTKASTQIKMWIASLHQMVLCLAGRTKHRLSFSDDHYDEDQHEATMRAGQAGASAQMHFFCKAVALWVHRDIDASCAAASLSAEAQIFTKATLQTVIPFSFFAALGRLEKTRMTLTDAKRDAAIMALKTDSVFAPALRALRAIAVQGPEIFGGLPTLMEAELASLRNQQSRANALYAKATQQLDKSGFLAFAAAGYECAGRHAERTQQKDEASRYLRRARDIYRAWGARIKVRVLELEFPNIVDTQGQDQVVTRHASSTRSDNHPSLDLPAILGVMQALSSETNLDRLVSKVLQAVLESAGATRAILLLADEQGELQVQSDSAPDANGYPSIIITFVARTQAPLVLDEPASNGDFQNDPYVQATQPQAILCAPLVYQAKLKGVIYLENKLSQNTFDEERMLITRLLAGQAAISLENAQAYHLLEERVERRTEELRHAQNQLLRLERDNAEMQMAGGFAHEMRNALAPAGMLLEGLAAKDDELSTLSQHAQVVTNLRQVLSGEGAPADKIGAALAAVAQLEGVGTALRNSLAMLNDALGRSLDVTTQILDYAEVGHIRPGDEQVPIAAVVDKVLQEFKNELEKNSIAIQLDLSPNTLFPIKEAHLYAVLRNLVGNACDALVEQKAAPRHIRIAARVENHTVTLEVQDTGPGIPDNVQQRMFQPFFTTKGAAGTGLGLGLARKLVEAYGGTLGFTSRPRAGTTFRVALPSLTQK